MTVSTTQDNRLINALLDPQVYEHAVDEIKLVETHISWVILTGPYAYKIKKPLDLGFLDFSTLDKRKQCCEEELRLNSRTADDIYLDVITINGTTEKPRLSAEGDIIEYAVKMHQFPQQSQLDRVLLRNELTPSILDSFARMIADFHQTVNVAGRMTEYGNGQQVLDPVNENLTQIRERIKDNTCDKLIDEIEQWIQAKYQTLLPLLEKRKQSGFIRECHGDLHLRNLAWIDNKPIAFDCIEFNPFLRWIDVISDIAFLVMDLQSRNQFNMSQQILNAYLEVTGDYTGIKLLSFYMMYRALVRAKVDAISLAQTHVTDIDNKDTENELYTYLNLAKSYSQPSSARLIITHGVSASGKTTFSQKLLQLIPAIRIRSDVERKRMANMKTSNHSNAAGKIDIYTKEFSDRVYNKLVLFSESIIDSGYSVIIDAAFLDKSKREQFKNLANTKKVEFIILDFTASEDILRERIIQRTQDASDADISVLETQLLNLQPLDEFEQAYSYTISANTAAIDIASLINH